MIHGHKPSGYTVTFTGEGHRVDGETRQCIHCQYTWDYVPGGMGADRDDPLRGTKRGWCYKCSGFLCGRQACILRQLQLTGNSTDCIPFEVWNKRLMDKVDHVFGGFKLPEDMTVTQEGLIIPMDKNQ